MGGIPSLRASELRYARTDDAHLAYRVIADETAPERDVVYVLAGTMPMDALFEDPVALRLLEGLAALGRVVLFDRLGIGLSDPPAGDGPTTFPQWSDDIAAVVAAAGLARPVLFTTLLGAGAALQYAADHPDDVESVVLLEPTLSRRDIGFVQDQIEGRFDPVAYLYPSRADEPGFREWFTRAGQRGASPRMAARVYPDTNEDELVAVRQATAGVRAPVLVLRRPANQLSPVRDEDPVMALLPGALRVDLPGTDLGPYGGEVDALVAEVFRFVTGQHRGLVPERALAAVMYTDLVGSTASASAVGDARWKRILDRHDDVARTTIGRRGGTVVKTTGDGFLAILPSAASALDAAREVRDALTREGLEVRIGLHVGDIDRRGDDISGVAVAIAARVQAIAAPGEILVTSSTAAAATGLPVRFEPRGEHALKGVPGTWSLTSAVW